MDGCGRVGIFFRVILPLMKPSLANAAIFFLLEMEELIGPMLYLTRPQTTRYRLQFLDASTSNWGAMFAMSVVSTACVNHLLYFPKYIVEGISTTGLK